MPYCLYLRKSRADLELEARGEMETLARHEKALLDLAGRMKLNVTQIYREIVSGESIAARPVMQQLIDEVEQGQWEGVLVMEVERLARGDTIDQGVVARAFKVYDTRIITPLKVYDPSNEYDEEYFEFGLFMSRREYKTINRRIQRGRIQSAKDGKYLGSTPPYGYDRVRITGDKGYTLRPNAEADTVRDIYRWYLAGDGCEVIARRLDELRIPTRSGRPWSKATIRDILSNPVYIGKIRWSYRVPPKGVSPDRKKDRRVVNDQYILVDGLHPALIRPEDFQLAADKMRHNRRRPVKHGTELQNPLTGLGYCAKCGSRLTRLGPNAHCPYDTLKCSNRLCNNVSAPLDLVEEEVILQLWRVLEQYQANTQKDAPIIDLDVQGRALRNIRDEIAKTETQIGRAYDLLEQGIYTPEVFTARQQALADRLASLTASAATLEESKRKMNAERARQMAIPEMLRLLEGYHGLNRAKDKNSILCRVLERFTYYKDQPNRRGQRNHRNFIVAVYPKLPY